MVDLGYAVGKPLVFQPRPRAAEGARQDQIRSRFQVGRVHLSNRARIFKQPRLRRHARGQPSVLQHRAHSAIGHQHAACVQRRDDVVHFTPPQAVSTTRTASLAFLAQASASIALRPFGASGADQLAYHSRGNATDGCRGRSARPVLPHSVLLWLHSLTHRLIHLVAV